ncbi:uncharacterized protein LOC102900478 isoform X2 [Felis catus]|uniref:uncharacterized protein LOC102900478 isoform X2 n=1 Tax=Felis catus TaxID=9685 RepID=UPI001D19D26F|nr:uncharacterized protein LOC102900478 isoform X2 [Felis catus]
MSGSTSTLTPHQGSRACSLLQAALCIAPNEQDPKNRSCFQDCSIVIPLSSANRSPISHELKPRKRPGYFKSSLSPVRTAVKKKCKADRGERGGLWTRQALLGDSVSPPSLTCSPAQPLLWAAFLAVAPEGSSWHHALRCPPDPHPQGTSPQLRVICG